MVTELREAEHARCDFEKGKKNRRNLWRIDREVFIRLGYYLWRDERTKVCVIPLRVYEIIELHGNVSAKYLLIEKYFRELRCYVYGATCTFMSLLMYLPVIYPARSGCD